MRKLAAPFVVLGLAVVLMGAGVAASANPDGAAPHVFTDSGLPLQLTSTTPGVTFSGNTLGCPALPIMTSSGVNAGPCSFTISSTGTVAPSAVAVTMSVSGITAAEASAKKFAVDTHSGSLIYLGTTSQTIYTFTGAQLPATVNPALLWGVNAGTALENSDMGAAIVITYTVVAEALQGATATPVTTATPVPTKTPGQIVAGATGAPGQTTTPPPTASPGGSSGSNPSTPLLALLVCLLFAGLGLSAVEYQRRSVRR